MCYLDTELNLIENTIPCSYVCKSEFLDLAAIPSLLSVDTSAVSIIPHHILAVCVTFQQDVVVLILLFQHKDRIKACLIHVELAHVFKRIKTSPIFTLMVNKCIYSKTAPKYNLEALYLSI